MKKRVLAISLGLVMMFSGVLSVSAQNRVVIDDYYGNLGWAYPVTRSFVEVSAAYQNYQYYLSEGNHHYGFDLVSWHSAIHGTNVYAAASGEVEKIFFNLTGDAFGFYLGVKTNNFDQYGNRLFYGYAHLLQQSVNPLTGTHFQVGDLVRRATIVGKVGNTGNSNGSHLHMEVTKNNWNNFNSFANTINPEWFYPNINFTRHYTTSFASTYPQYALSLINSLNIQSRYYGLYSIDISLINYVGDEEFNRWIVENNAKANSELTVIDFLDDFEISNAEFERIVNGDASDGDISKDTLQLYNIKAIEELRING